MVGTSSIPLITRAEEHEERTAIIATEGVFTYSQLLEYSGRVASSLLDGADDLRETRVAFLASPGFQYVATQWGIWRAGGVAVPLSVLHPRPELEYSIEDSDAGILIAHPDFKKALRHIAEERGLRFMLTSEALAGARTALPEVPAERRAMILYTSGTTDRPKGVVTTHQNIQAQVTSLVSAWGWTPEDHILHVLPLHHVHGIINVLTCTLWTGAKCEMLPRFDAKKVWSCIAGGDLTLFMAVPTIYEKLIAEWEATPPEEQKIMLEACSRMRLMVSGSAALPVRTFQRWKTISGHVILERYGMTEIGMALSNPLHGRRAPGYVGTPLPYVEVRLVDEDGNLVGEGTAGEIQVRGPTVFLEYWRRPEATKNSFQDGWFRTGDIAVRENRIYRILGRKSIDIIKPGGYKVSALEIEEVLRTHPLVEQCAVVGLEDPVWGERVCAALVLKGNSGLRLDSLREWAKERLAPYKIPTKMLLLDDLPHNALGKVTKPDVVQMFKAKELGV